MQVVKGDNAVNLIERAKAFATKAHEGQMRKDGKNPYITHPEAVAKYVAESEYARTVWPESIIAAAWLHDVVEDCNVTLGEIEKEFGPKVRHLVDGVTDFKLLKPRVVRHYAFTMKVYNYALNDNGVMLIKLCDMMHNLETSDGVGPEFRRVMAAEKLCALDTWEKLMRADNDNYMGGSSSITQFFPKLRSKCLEILPELKEWPYNA